MWRATLITRKRATKMELNFTRKTMPIASPAKKGSENKEKTMALPARSDLEEGAAKAAFQALPQTMARPEDAKLHRESQKEIKTVPNKLRGDCRAATPRTTARLKMTAGIKQ